MKINCIKRLCPICGSSNFRKEISSKIKAENSDFTTLQKTWNGFFKEKIIFTYVRCANCKTLYCPEFFNNIQLSMLSSQMPANMDEVPLAALKKTQRGYIIFSG